MAQVAETVNRMGGVLDPHAIAADLQARIDEATKLLRPAPAASVPMADLRRQAVGRPEYLAVRVAGRLQAALSQALIYAAVNGDQRRPRPVLDLRDAGEAMYGLGVAIRDAPDGSDLVTIGADVAAGTRQTLEVFQRQLRTGAWSFCPCGDDHGQDETDSGVLDVITRDLLYLAPPAN
jgi:hypothetical protein